MLVPLSQLLDVVKKNHDKSIFIDEMVLDSKVTDFQKLVDLAVQHRENGHFFWMVVGKVDRFGIKSTNKGQIWMKKQNIFD